MCLLNCCFCLNSLLIRSSVGHSCVPRREGGLVNIKDKIGFVMWRLVGLLALEEGGGGDEAASERTVLMSKMLVA